MRGTISKTPPRSVVDRRTDRHRELVQHAGRSKGDIYKGLFEDVAVLETCLTRQF